VQKRNSLLFCSDRGGRVAFHDECGWQCARFALTVNSNIGLLLFTPLPNAVSKAGTGSAL